MKINFITLFDINYIERGLALFFSLNNVCNDFSLFVISFDDECYFSLKKLNLDNLTVIKYSEFENDKLKLAKSNRSKREYLWTCSSFGIKYVLDKYKLDNITYIDSDMFFYSDPTSVINRFIDSDKDVALISHRFSNNFENKYFERMCGKYCVEFNSFKNTENGMRVLEWWCQKCFESCPDKPNRYAFGDQKYLDSFEELFSGIYIYDDFGLGLAPWNVDDYRLISDITLKNKSDGKVGELIFYHFHSLNLYDNKAIINVYTRPGKKDDNLINFLYLKYLNEIKKYMKLVNKEITKSMDIGGSGSIQRTLEYIFEEKNLIISINKLYRLIFYRKKDIFDFN